MGQTELIVLITGILAILQPPIIDFGKEFFNHYIKSEELRKSANVIFSIIIGIVLALLVDFSTPEVSLPFYEILIIGTGVSFPLGQLSHRAIKLTKSGIKKIDG